MAVKFPRSFGRASSNAAVFANRGDPWISERDSEESWPVDKYREMGPEMDQYLTPRPKFRIDPDKPTRGTRPALPGSSRPKAWTNSVSRVRRFRATGGLD